MKHTRIKNGPWLYLISLIISFGAARAAIRTHTQLCVSGSPSASIGLFVRRLWQPFRRTQWSWLRDYVNDRVMSLTGINYWLTNEPACIVDTRKECKHLLAAQFGFASTAVDILAVTNIVCGSLLVPRVSSGRFSNNGLAMRVVAMNMYFSLVLRRE